MKILMCGSPNVGIGVWRQVLPGKALKSLGHKVVNLQQQKDEGPESFLRRIAQELEKEQWDIVWTGAYNPAMESLARKTNEWGIPFIFDLDDYAHGIPSYNPASKMGANRGSLIIRYLERILPHTNAISCATPFLKDFYGELMGDPDHTFLCPNIMDPGIFSRDVEPIRDPRLRVCVVYNAGRHGDLRPLLPMMRELAENDSIRLLSMGAFPEEWWCMDPHLVKWCGRAEIEQFWYLMQINQPDVIVSRLQPNDFNEAKSNIKWIEAALTNSVLVGSNFGELKRATDGSILINHNDDLKVEVGEWKDALVELAEDKQQGGDKATLKVAKASRFFHENYSLAKGRKLWENCAKAAYKRGLIQAGSGGSGDDE